MARNDRKPFPSIFLHFHSFSSIFLHFCPFSSIFGRFLISFFSRMHSKKLGPPDRQDKEHLQFIYRFTFTHFISFSSILPHFLKRPTLCPICSRCFSFFQTFYHFPSFSSIFSRIFTHFHPFSYIFIHFCPFSSIFTNL